VEISREHRVDLIEQELHVEFEGEDAWSAITRNGKEQGLLRHTEEGWRVEWRLKDTDLQRVSPAHMKELGSFFGWVIDQLNYIKARYRDRCSVRSRCALRLSRARTVQRAGRGLKPGPPTRRQCERS
jgi:hypothetical protein